MKKSFFQLIKNPEITEVFFKKNFKFNKTGKIDLNMETTNSITLDEENKIAQVLLSLDIFKDNRTSPFTAKISIQGLFSWDRNLSKNKQQLEKLLTLNAPAILYSYLRPIISNLTVQSGISPLVLPIMDFTDTENIIKKGNL